MEPTIYFVIPCYNEEAVLPETTRRLAEKLQAMQSAGLIGKDSRVLYVDDGSKDKTWQLISQFHQEYPWVEGVKLAHNRGHQNALLCGLMTAKDRCHAAISMDADLQDDIDAPGPVCDKVPGGLRRGLRRAQQAGHRHLV